MSRFCSLAISTRDVGESTNWLQAIAQFLSTRGFAFSIVLATYLAGLVAGSALYRRIADRVRDPWSVFGFLIAAAGLVGLLQVAFLGDWLMSWQSDIGDAVRALTGKQLAVMCGLLLVAALVIVLPPTLLLGAAFPAALRIAASPERVGRDVGAIVALNTAAALRAQY